MADKLEGTAIIANTVSGDRIVAGSITSTQLTPSIATTVATPLLKVRSITYPGNDTAANTGGGQTIVLTGTGFGQNVQVYINSNAVPSVTRTNANSISFTTPALAAATYPIYVINTDDGATAILIPGIQYSGTPTWVTTTPLTTQDAAIAWNIQLVATSDSTISYSLQAGSSLPAGITLAANGLISGTMSSPPEDETTYNFTVIANDLEQQDSSRAFSVSVTVAALDPFFGYTTLLLHGDGTNNQNNNVFLDSSNNNFTLTRFGNATQGTFSPYGDNWSNYFPSTGSYLSIADNDGFNLTGNFTIEYWVHQTTRTNYGRMFSFGTYNAANSFGAEITGSGTITVWYNTTQYDFTSLFIPLNQWTHIAFVRSSTTITVYINGFACGTITSASAAIDRAQPLYIANLQGLEGDGNAQYIGYISNFSILKGTAKYTSNFTVPTQPLTPVSNTSLLTCQSNSFVDKGPIRPAITRNGSAAISKFDPYKQFKVVPASYGVYFDGNGDYLTAPSNSAFSLGTGDFTVEFWVYKFSAVNALILDARSGITASPWVVGIDGSNFPYLYDGSTYTSTVAITNNSWTHVVIARFSGTLRMFVNGVQGYSNSYTTNLDRSAGIFIGARVSDAAAPFNGHISNLRIVKGTAVYTSTFTPPTSPLTAIANTSLLACQSTALIDNSNNTFTITRNGDARPTDLNPFTPALIGQKYNTANGGGSLYVDGTGDYLTAPSNTALAFGTGDFTIEAWVYRKTSGSVVHFIDFRGNNNNDSNPVFYFQTNDYLYYTNNNTSGDNQIQTQNPVLADRWTHIALVRSGTTLTAYINGVASGSTTYSTNVLGGNPVTIANRYNDSGAFNGYISNLRILKGTAAYTNNFVPPATPITNAANTSLLCNFTNGGVIDSVGKTTVETVGDTKVNTSIKKFGTGSIFFDGTGDWLAAPFSQELAFGTGDFTIEGWFYNSASQQGASGIFSYLAGTTYFVMHNNTGNYPNKLTLWIDNYGTGPQIVGGTTLAQNTWYHFAISRASGVWRLFLNGTQDASSYTNTAEPVPAASQLRIGLGNNSSSAGGYTGYIDDFRITKGIARYRYNFTPPTKAFNDGDGNLANNTTDVLVGDQVNTPMFPYTTMLLPGNGTNNANNHAFVDSSTNNFAITRNGNTTQGTFSPFSLNGWSNFFDGSGDYLTVPSNSAFDFASGNFTIEGWIYFTNSEANALQTIYTNYTNFGSAGSIFFGKHTNASGRVTVWFSNYSGGSPLLAESSLPPNNIWVHYALVRNGNVFTLYRNGVATASAEWQGAATSGANALYIGAAGDAAGSYDLPGYISNFRIVKGTAVYTSNFTPPTTPLTAISNTSLLICQSNRFIDNSTNNFAITRFGGVSVQAFSPFPPSAAYNANTNGGSAYFDGTGDFLNFSASSISTSADFTVECWIYPNASISATNYGIFALSDARFGLITVTGNLYLLTSTGDINTSTALPLYQWNHVAVTRTSGVLRVFLNGSQVGATQSNSQSLSGIWRIASNQSGEIFPACYISGARILINTGGTSLPTPTSPPTAITNTNFLCNFTNAGIFDATGDNVLETVGDVRVNTAISKFGTGSIYFDGTGDFIKLPNSRNFNFGTGDFTIEFWFRRVGTNGQYARYFQTADGDVFTGVSIGQNNTSQNALIVALSSSGSSWDITDTLTAQFIDLEWNHFALVRSGSNFRTYVNGILNATRTSSAALYFSTSETPIIGGQSSGRNLNGHMQDFRVTKGIARYVNNFIPPTASFPTK